jgi:hypothetical protein
MPAPVLSPLARILQVCEPFLIANAGIRQDLRLDPLGVAIPPENVFDPQHRRHAKFLEMLQLVDRLTFGPFGMEMPSWVFYDCAVMPGAVFGLGVRAERMAEWAREAMRVPDDYTGLVPVSQFIAIPTVSGFAGRGPHAAPGSWLLYTLESLNQVSPGMAPWNTLKLTFALGLHVFPIDELYGISQWRSPKLATYVELAPLELLSAWTPAHSLPHTLSFRIPWQAISIDTLVAGPLLHPGGPAPNTLLDVDDLDAVQALQREIEAGVQVQIVGKALEHGAQVLVPLYKQSITGRIDGQEA